MLVLVIALCGVSNACRRKTEPAAPQTATQATPTPTAATDVPRVENSTASNLRWDYWLRYNPNGGTGGYTEHLSNGSLPYEIIGSEINKIGNKGPYVDIIVSREGYTFKYWNTKADGTGKIIEPGFIVNTFLDIDGAWDLYAIWEKN